MSLRESTPEAVKSKLRKTKSIPPAVKAAVYAGCLQQGAAMQFNRDVMVYNLWEALLYVEGYEDDGYFTHGTAAKAIALCK